ncbi:MAG: hypothetical protein FWE03_02700 [Firmicutes bacterium]|nr:hypothetical protein [Bacillota bacterium]
MDIIVNVVAMNLGMIAGMMIDMIGIEAGIMDGILMIGGKYVSAGEDVNADFICIV